VVIRPMREEDRDAAMAILEAWNMAPREGEEVERSGLDAARSFVAEKDGEVVGITSWIKHDDECAETASLAVHPAAKGEGLGARLQEARLDAMRKQGIRRVRTETDRPETIAWYMRHWNYAKVGTNPKKHAFSLPDEHEWTVLELALEPPG